MAIARIKLLQNKREMQLKLMRKEIAQFLQAGQEAIARIRVGFWNFKSSFIKETVKHCHDSRQIESRFRLLMLSCIFDVVVGGACNTRTKS